MDYRKAPCKGCLKRFPGCHSSCEDYKEFRARLDAINKKKRKEWLINDDVWKLTLKSMKRTQGKSFKIKENTKKWK